MNRLRTHRFSELAAKKDKYEGRKALRDFMLRAIASARGLTSIRAMVTVHDMAGIALHNSWITQEQFDKALDDMRTAGRERGLDMSKEAFQVAVADYYEEKAPSRLRSV